MSIKKIAYCHLGGFGYTLIELMAVIGIMAVMATVAVTSYSGTKQSTALDKAVRQLVMDLRRAQNMAMNTAVFGGSVPSGGYGLHLTAGSGAYNLFADVSGDKQYTPGGSEDVANQTFDSPIVISGVAPSIADIIFFPPNPSIFFNGSAAASDVVITVKYGATALTKTITVNGLTGQISVGN